jgi:hypothetical protein
MRIIRFVLASALVGAAGTAAMADYVAPHEVGNRGFYTSTAWHSARGYWMAGGLVSPHSQEGPKWTKLYNGKDLTGWHVKDGKVEAWKANGDMISCVANGGGWLASDKHYGDFELRLEYRIPAGGNSGLGIRFPTKGDPAHVGMEIQILDDDAAQYASLKPAQYNGGIYYQSPAKAKAAKKPGEWNRYEVHAKGPHIRVVLNGVEVQNVNVEEFTKAEGNYTPLAQRPRSGHVGMQSHGNQVDFRNIEIREL